MKTYILVRTYLTSNSKNQTYLETKDIIERIKKEFFDSKDKNKIIFPNSYKFHRDKDIDNETAKIDVYQLSSEFPD